MKSYLKFVGLSTIIIALSLLAFPAPLQASGTSGDEPSLVIKSFSPSSVFVGSGHFNLTVHGENFTSHSVVYYMPRLTMTGHTTTVSGVGLRETEANTFLWGEPRKTTFINSGEITAKILSSDIMDPLPCRLFVYDSTLSDGYSEPFDIVVSSEVYVLESVTPKKILVNTRGKMLTIKGSHFTSNAVVLFDGQPLRTTFVSSTELRTCLGASYLETPGNFSIRVVLFVGGEEFITSNSIPLMVYSVKVIDRGNARQVAGDQGVNTIKLHQNYPNPFNPTTSISFEITGGSQVTLKVYNTLGQEVATILNQANVDKGFQQVSFDGSKLTSGIYYYRLTVQETPDDGTESQRQFVETKQMIIMK